MQNIKNPVGQDLKKLYGVIFMKRSKGTFLSKIALILVSLSVIGLASLLGAYIYVRANVDYSADEALFAASRGIGATTFYYDSSGGERSYEPIELCIYKGASVKKDWTDYEDIGDNIKNAFLATEDRNFFKHNGVDVKRTLLALLNSVFRIM